MWSVRTSVERQNIGGASEQECVCVVTSTLFIQGERWCGYIGGTRVREFYVTSTLPRCHVNTIEVERLNRSVGCLLLHQHNSGGTSEFFRVSFVTSTQSRWSVGALERWSVGALERLNIGGTSEHRWDVGTGASEHRWNVRP